MLFRVLILCSLCYIGNVNLLQTNIINFNYMDNTKILSTLNLGFTNNSYFCYSSLQNIIFYSNDSLITKYYKICYKLILYDTYSCLEYTFLNFLYYKKINQLNEFTNDKCRSVFSFFMPTGEQCISEFDPHIGNMNRIRPYKFIEIFGNNILIDSTNTTFTANFNIEQKSIWYYMFSPFNSFRKEFSIHTFILYLLKYNHYSNITLNTKYNFKNIGLINKYLIKDEVCTKKFITNMSTFKYFNKTTQLLYDFNDDYMTFNIKFIKL